MGPHHHFPATGPRRIGVVVTRQIGDVLLTTPLIEAAHRCWPAAQVEVIGFAGTLGMLAGNPAVAARVEIPKRPGWRGALALLRRLWRRYELVLIAEPSDRAHLIGWVASRCRAGLVPQRRSHAWWKRLLLTHAVTTAGDRSERHVAAEKLALMAPWRAGEAAMPVVAPAAHSLPRDVAAQLGAAPVVVHAASMWSYKQWPIAHYARVVEALLAEGRQVVLTGGGESDRRIVAPLAALASAPQLLDLCGRLDFNQLATLLRAAALYIGPDTSITHLAASVGVPVVTVFGPTNPARWGPIDAVAPSRSGWVRDAPLPPVAERSMRRGAVILLQGPGDCVPCSRAGCEDHRLSESACLLALAPERVLAAATLLAPLPAAAEDTATG